MRIRNLLIVAVLGAIGFQNAYSQQDAPPQMRSMTGTFTAKTVDLPGGGIGVSFGDPIIEVNPVKNAPFAAEAVNESIFVLADGNRIFRKSTTKMFRDSEGRTRREAVGGGLPVGITLSVPTPFGPTATPVSASTAQMQIQISDPVAGVTYVLDPETRTARKYVTFLPGVNVAALVERAKAESTATGKTVTIREGNAVVSMTTNPGPSMTSGIESLGTKIIEGVECVGTLMSSTIPAGQIGNEQPIMITAERWYSQKLQTEVVVKRNDPRSGENNYKMTNIDQSEPPASLFQVPPDYAIIDMAGSAKEPYRSIEIIRK